MTSSRFSYRMAEKSDAHEMLGVHFAAVQAIAPDFYADEVKLAWSPPPDLGRQKWLSDLVSLDSTMCVVALSEQGAVVGFCIALPSRSELKALYVHPEHSGLGVGRALLQSIEARCGALGLAVLELKASYNAEGFYRQSGYEAIGPATQQLSDAVSMAAVHMAKRLRPVVQPVG